MISKATCELLMQRQAADGLFFERLIAQIFSARVRPGDVCVDGGANNGLHTLPLCRLVWPQGHVFAVEAFSSLATALAGRRCTSSTQMPRSAFSAPAKATAEARASLRLYPGEAERTKPSMASRNA